MLVLISHWASGQNQPKIDSLRTLAQETRHDTVRINAFTLLMSEFMASDTSETTRLRDLAIEESEKVSYTYGLFEAYFQYGYLKSQLGNTDSARWYFDKSYQYALQTNNIELVTQALTEIGSSYYYESNYEQALKYYEASKAAAKARGARDIYAKNISNIANIYYAQAKYDTAIYFFRQTAAVQDSLRNNKSIDYAITLQNLGNAYQSLNNFPRALDYFFQSLKISESTGDSVGVAYLTGNIGVTYIYQGETDLGLQYLFRSKSTKEQLGMKRSLTYTYYNIGWTYTTLKDYEESERYMKIALEIAKATNVTGQIAYSHAGLGEIYFDLEQYDRAKLHFDSALVIRKQLNLPHELSQTFNLLGMLATKQNRYQQAIDYYNKGLTLGEELEVPELIRNISLNQAELYAKMGHFQKAYEVHIRYKAMDDTIRNEDNTRKIALLESEYAFEKEKESIAKANERERRLQEQELQKQRYYTYASTGGLLSLLLIAFFIYRNYQQKQKANRLLAEKNEEILHQSQELEHKNQHLEELSTFKQGLTDMIAHDMKNPLNVVIGLSEGAPDANKMKQVNQSGKLMLQMVTNMLDVQKFDEADMKLNLAPHTLLDILVQAKFQVELLSIARSIQLDFQQVSKDFHLYGDREVIMRVFVNLFTNGIKYSDPGSKITVKAEVVQNRLKIAVTDKGKGIHEADLPYLFDKFWQTEAKKSGQIQSTGLGLTFCKIAVEAHGGTINATSSPGKGSTFTFDLAVGNLPAVTPKSKTELSQSEFEAIQEIIQEIRQIPLYQFADIEAALLQIPMESESINEWKEALSHAALNWDEDGFEKLLRQKEISKR